jgi:hypothetical protein
VFLLMNQLTLLPPGRHLLDLFDAVVVRWHDRERSIHSWEDAQRELSAPGGADVHLAHRLAVINTFQWHEEDRSRDLGADDTVLADVKRSIDASNRRRVQTVDALDAWYVTSLDEAGRQDPSAPLHTESAGSLVDRLSILALKLYHVREAGAAMGPRLAILEEQSSDLADGLDRLQAEILAGRLRLKLYRQIKVYRDAADIS